ncbi:MAG TPA: hypothetical protein VG737_18105 [Cyclobacteriaceae bacterium]|nr:hypothetical protein [Cyclobacteriaceae bacterium]
MADIRKHGLLVTGIVLGMAGGFLYWKYVGCLSGSCPITSSPTYSTIYGALIGGTLLSMFKKETKKETRD